ncbi:MAG: FtsL-like putative cell division protein [Bacteroidota bacterium]
MAVNTFKLKEGTSKRSIFSRVERWIRLEGVFGYGLPLKYLPYVLFVTAVGIFYIGNSHYAEKNIRKIDAMKKEIEDLRADYTTLKADYMYASKQSEVAKKVEKLGIKESLRPPEKITITAE